jgi:hypothetical protein
MSQVLGPIGRSAVFSIPVVRRVGFSILAVLAIIVWFSLAPSKAKSVAQYERAIAAASSDFETNNGTADSAPQQSVVNGWFSRDIQTIMAEQNNDLLRTSSDRRVPALLLLGLLAFCLHCLTLPGQASTVASQPSPPGPQPDARQSAESWSFPVAGAPPR